MVWFIFILNIILLAGLLWRHYQYKSVISMVKELVERVESQETGWLDAWHDELVEQGIEKAIWEEDNDETATR